MGEHLGGNCDRTSTAPPLDWLFWKIVTALRQMDPTTDIAVKALPPKERQPGQSESLRCNCKKSKCLKLYCECFALGFLCADSCKCRDCRNNPKHREQRDRACKETVKKNPRAFEPKIPAEQAQAEGGTSSHRRGCRCKKSNCLKRYCECYNGEVLCSAVCRCQNCHNNDNDNDEDEPAALDEHPEPKQQPYTKPVDPIPAPAPVPAQQTKNEDVDHLETYLSSPPLDLPLETIPPPSPLESRSSPLHQSPSIFRPPYSDLSMTDLMRISTPVSKGQTNLWNPFSPAAPLAAIEDTDADALSFLLSPKVPSPFKTSNSWLHRQKGQAIRSIHMRNKATNFRMTKVAETSSATKSVQVQVVGACMSGPFISPQKPLNPPERTKPSTISMSKPPLPKKRKNDCLVPAGGVPKAPVPCSPPMKKQNMGTKTGLTNGPQSFLSSPLGQRGDVSPSPVKYRPANWSSSIKLSRRCTLAFTPPKAPGITKAPEPIL